MTLTHCDPLYCYFQESLARVASAVNTMVVKLLRVLQRLNDHLDGLDQPVYKTERRLTGRKGRPKFIIRENSLSGLIALNFSWTAIARLFGKENKREIR